MIIMNVLSMISLAAAADDPTGPPPIWTYNAVPEPSPLLAIAAIVIAIAIAMLIMRRRNRRFFP